MDPASADRPFQAVFNVLARFAEQASQEHYLRSRVIKPGSPSLKLDLWSHAVREQFS